MSLFHFAAWWKPQHSSALALHTAMAHQTFPALQVLCGFLHPLKGQLLSVWMALDCTAPVCSAFAGGNLIHLYNTWHHFHRQHFTWGMSIKPSQVEKNILMGKKRQFSERCYKNTHVRTVDNLYKIFHFTYQMLYLCLRIPRTQVKVLQMLFSLFLQKH